ncbi:hypothetical protein [Schaalia sp. ZJ1691]|uniref:hypothetical protein n=1 Tax=Schaalia sp. ZJ1691 TaxID=2709404 RepID=UPI0013EBD39B|nr:hypothetical protein [Schaalia sp. ZJ1691]
MPRSSWDSVGEPTSALILAQTTGQAADARTALDEDEVDAIADGSRRRCPDDTPPDQHLH